MKRMIVLILIAVVVFAVIICLASFTPKNVDRPVITESAESEPTEIFPPVVDANKPDNDDEDLYSTSSQEADTQESTQTETDAGLSDESVMYTYGDIGVHVAYNVRLTAYCGCEICCGSYGANRPVDENGKTIVYTGTGAIARQGVTVAISPSFIPYGAYVYVQNPWSGEWHEYIAQDTSPVDYHVDIYYDDHTDALNSGYGGWGTVYWSMEPVDVTTLA